MLTELTSRTQGRAPSPLCTGSKSCRPAPLRYRREGSCPGLSVKWFNAGTAHPLVRLVRPFSRCTPVHSGPPPSLLSSSPRSPIRTDTARLPLPVLPCCQFSLFSPTHCVRLVLSTPTRAGLVICPLVIRPLVIHLSNHPCIHPPAACPHLASTWTSTSPPQRRTKEASFPWYPISDEGGQPATILL